MYRFRFIEDLKETTYRWHRARINAPNMKRCTHTSIGVHWYLKNNLNNLLNNLNNLNIKITRSVAAAKDDE